MASKNEWYCRVDEEVTGPFTKTEIRGLARTGKLKPDDSIRRAGKKKWQRAGDFKSLFDAPSRHPRQEVEELTWSYVGGLGPWTIFFPVLVVTWIGSFLIQNFILADIRKISPVLDWCLVLVPWLVAIIAPVTRRSHARMTLNAETASIRFQYELCGIPYWSRHLSLDGDMRIAAVQLKAKHPIRGCLGVIGGSIGGAFIFACTGHMWNAPGDGQGVVFGIVFGIFIFVALICGSLERLKELSRLRVPVCPVDGDPPAHEEIAYAIWLVGINQIPLTIYDSKSREELLQLEETLRTSGRFEAVSAKFLTSPTPRWLSITAGLVLNYGLLIGTFLIGCLFLGYFFLLSGVHPYFNLIVLIFFVVSFGKALVKRRTEVRDALKADSKEPMNQDDR